MKRYFWLGLLFLTTVVSGAAQSLAGVWQGVEDAKTARHYPAVLRVQRGQGARVFGILYQEVGDQPNITVTFEMEGMRMDNSLKLNHVDKLNETGQSPFSHWCDGSITFSYDPALEKLTGHASYEPVGNCDTGEFVFYRVKLKSAPTVQAGALSTLRVSGRDVRWYRDAAHKQLVASGNVFVTRLLKPTTFYLTQGFYPSAESQAVPITIATTGTAPKLPAPAAPRPTAPAAPRPAPTPPPAPDTARARPPVVAALPTLPPTNAPLVLPTVLFQLSTPELLPSAYAALDQLAAALRAQPQVRLRVVGHTDRLAQDDPAQNQTLSEQRAAAVKAYLVKAGIDPARLSTAGYGDTRRLYPSPDVRNRRVEIERLPE